MYNLTQVMAIVWTLWSLGCATTIARIVLRLKAQGNLRAEDYLAILAFLFLTGLSAVVTRETPVFEMTQAYLLAAVEDPTTPLPLPLDEYTARTVTVLKLMFAQMLLFWSTLWAGKLSLLVFFRGMVRGLPKYMYIWWAVFTVVVLTYLASMLSNFLTCVPLEKYWSATGCSDAKNLKRSDASIKFATSIDIFADLLIMALPVRLLMTLRITLKQKLALTCLFSLGTIVIIFAFVRLFQVIKATADSQTDPTTVANGPILLSLWSVIEAAVAVVVTNLPAFRSLLRNRGDTGDRKLQSRYIPGYSNGYTNTIGSRTNRGKTTIVGRTMEMESLHSSDDVARQHVNDLEPGQDREAAAKINER